MNEVLDRVRFDDRGLVSVVVQDTASGAVLMVAWANREALELTRDTGLGHFWSRSRQALWRKGETSGNQLRVAEVLVDCDGDTLIYRVRAEGPACHLGSRSCFEPNPVRLELGWLAEVIAARRAADPESSYTRRLLDQGLDRVAQKVGEEAVEVVIAALAGVHERTISESADLLYHLLVLLEASGVDPLEVAAELELRHLPPDEGVRE